jgi:hypothetical protein
MRSSGRPRRKWEDKIKLYPTETGKEGSELRSFGYRQEPVAGYNEQN